jgi:hypothetical protein
MVRCRVCGKELKNPQHEKEGIGPVCKTKQGHKIHNDMDRFMPKPLPQELSTQFYNKLAITNCKICQTKLPDRIEHYEHDGGVEVPGMDKKQWLFITCPRCEQQW